MRHPSTVCAEEDAARYHAPHALTPGFTQCSALDSYRCVCACSCILQSISCMVSRELESLVALHRRPSTAFSVLQSGVARRGNRSPRITPVCSFLHLNDGGWRCISCLTCRVSYPVRDRVCEAMKAVPCSASCRPSQTANSETPTEMLHCFACRCMPEWPPPH